jgi:formylmethanofuran dehydrogenase subunit E
VAQRGEGVCTECGEHTEITVIDDVNMLCDDCIDELDYIECDECKELWLWDAIKFYNLSDGRVLCQYCAEKMLQDEDIAEDDIDSIDDYT